jgi:hypothetical protein
MSSSRANSPGGVASTAATKIAPALETRTSISPASRTAEVMLSGLVTSSASRWPAGRPASVLGSGAVAITRWPRRANSAAVARPMPFDAPVISTDAMTTSRVRKLGRSDFRRGLSG